MITDDAINSVKKYSKEYKVMGYVITGVVVVAVAFIAYNKYIQNKTLSQQSIINKYTIAAWRKQHTVEQQKDIESSTDVIEKRIKKII